MCSSNFEYCSLLVQLIDPSDASPYCTLCDELYALEVVGQKVTNVPVQSPHNYASCRSVVNEIHEHLSFELRDHR